MMCGKRGDDFWFVAREDGERILEAGGNRRLGEMSGEGLVNTWFGVGSEKGCRLGRDAHEVGRDRGILKPELR